MIICLGWGSLIWDRQELPVAGHWHDDGPQLPVEFTRVSRDGRLTLVITKDVPLVTVLWTPLSVSSLDDGITALAERESVLEENIGGSIGVWSTARSSRHRAVSTVGGWATERGFDAVIWTALTPGFQGKRGAPPKLEEALAHLRGLEGESRKNAEEYIRRAPAQIKTLYRAAIEDEFKWTPV